MYPVALLLSCEKKLSTEEKTQSLFYEQYIKFLVLMTISMQNL